MIWASGRYRRLGYEWPGAVGAPRVPALVVVAGARASMRFLEFFARRAYARAANEFLGWCASVGVPSIADVQPVHVAMWIEAGTRELTAPRVKLRLAAIRIYLIGSSSARSYQ
jgi:hypothetical protein